MTADDDPFAESGAPRDGERPRIKVTDRRTFDRDGNRKPEPKEEEAEPAAEAATPEPAAREPATPEPAIREPAAPEPATPEPAIREPATREPATREPAIGDAARQATEEPSGSDTASATGATPPDDADGPSRIHTSEPSAADLPRDFSAFVESMYLEAMLYLGALADPRTGQSMEDIELAKYKIDLLAMLQEKTAGNLQTEEAGHLEEALYQLRMVYLQKTKVAKI